MSQANDVCETLFSFFLGELPETAKKAFEAHLPGCSACREQLIQLQQTWDTLPFSSEELEPPEQLKSEVLGAILREYPADDAVAAPTPDPEHSFAPMQVPANVPESAAPAHANAQAYSAGKRGNRSIWRYAAAVAIVLLVGVAGWTEVSKRLEKPSGRSELHIPSQLLEQYSLKSFDPTIPAAAGRAWIMKKGNSMELVLQTSGLPRLQGNQVYQVWLVKNGERNNCGTFRVDPEGNGVLTYVIDEQDRAFDTIGITLEPDSEGKQPRGKKILGT